MDKTLSLDEFQLGTLESAYEEDSYELTSFLDLRNEEVVTVFEHGDGPDEDRVREQIEADTEGRYLEIPRGNSDRAWEDMQKFALSLEDERVSDMLLTAIRGKGAFRRFKRVAYEEGVRQAWFEFRDRRVRRRVLDWLQVNDLITEEQSRKHMEQLEERIEKRRQRRRDMQEMTEGTRVECRDPADYPGLSEGTRYDVEGERPGQNLIRVRDDRGKLRWYPKPQFRLLREPS